jgi:hypothetical protein
MTIRLLEPFAKATHLLEGRSQHGRYSAIWEVLVTFEWLLDQLEALKDRLKDVDYEDPDSPEDHLVANVNLAHTKLSQYYAKFDDTPVYYAATILHPHYKHHLVALWEVLDTQTPLETAPITAMVGLIITTGRSYKCGRSVRMPRLLLLARQQRRR